MTSRITLKMPEVSFLSSQITGVNGIFEVMGSSYEKWGLQNASILCLGDISGTGTTLINSIDRLVKQYDLEGKQPSWMLILTIGSFDALSSLQLYASQLLSTWRPQLKGVSFVFLEQVFRLYRGGGVLATSHLPYADFFRQSYPGTPEFEKSSLARPICFLERCAIYNIGSRAFAPKTYLDNLKKYWMMLAEQSRTLDTLRFLKLKSNLFDYRLGFNSWRRARPWWDSIDEGVLRALHENGSHVLDELLRTSLTDICELRLSMMGGDISPG